MINMLLSIVKARIFFYSVKYNYLLFETNMIKRTEKHHEKFACQ